MKYDLEKILPHSYPMILIDEIQEANLDEGFITTLLTIRKDNLFFDSNLGGVSYLTGIEFMAQTIACYAQLKFGSKTPKIGFLLGTRSYKAYVPKFEENVTYEVKAKELYCDNELVSFECFIYNDGKVCANAMVNAYQPANAEDFLKKGIK